MEHDFGGYVTKVGIRCTDGRTITSEAFKHMDGQKVPLVWMHGHGDAENVLGHTLLEAREDGVYGRSFFNSTPKAQHTKASVEHGDVTMQSIYANGLVEKAGKQVVHGNIREVSLVLAGANSGAKIDFVRVVHGDGFEEMLDDEAVITTGETLEFSHAETETEEVATKTDDPQLAEIYNGMSPKEKEVVHFMIEATLAAASEGEVEHAETELDDEALSHAVGDGMTVGDVLNGMSEVQKNVLDFMIGLALQNAGVAHSDTDPNTPVEDALAHQEGTHVTGNVFDRSVEKKDDRYTLSHSDMAGIFADAPKMGSLKESLEAFAMKHGIDDIELLFPDAKNLTLSPSFVKRRTEWVAGVLDGVSRTPFSRIKTMFADITQDAARARGHIKGTYKTEEWFGVSKRTTTPTMVYKKQKLDRQDILSITDFSVVDWLWIEMRVMLEEELARAILIGDGRAVENEDKIKDPAGASEGEGIRSIYNEHEFYATTLYANVGDANSNYEEVVDLVLDGMEFYKGTGTPTLYTTIRNLNMFLKAKDGEQRRYYTTKAEVAAALGVKDIITVEPMNEVDDLIGIIVNLEDYNVGMDRGGEITRFDQFDIDYNQFKYLMETFLSGALIKYKSALIIKKTASGNVLVSTQAPTFAKTTGVVTIPTVTGVNYKVNGTGGNLTPGAQTAIAAGATVRITAHPASGYYFSDNVRDEWSFTRDPA